MFFELRQYRMRPGKKEEWLKMMQEEIIPYQISKGMVVVGSFTAPEEDDLYIWIRRFASEEERKSLYEATYQDDVWVNDMAPRVGKLIDRAQIKVTLMEATPKSVIQ